MSCPETAPTLGAYVLGALDRAERERFEEHLDRCPVCAAELAEFAALPGLLDRVPPEELEPVAVAPSPGLYDRVAAAARPPRTSTARRWLLVAAAVLAVLGAGAGVTAWLAGDDTRTATAAEGPVQATVSVREAGDGSALDVQVSGLRPGETCWMVAVDEDGVRHTAGSWPVSASGGGEWHGWYDLDDDAVQAVLLLGDGGRELVRVVF